MAAVHQPVVVTNPSTDVALEKRVDDRVEQARAFRVTDATSYKMAAAALIAIKALRQEVNEAFDSIIADANTAHKNAIAKKKQYAGPLIESEDLYNATMRAYIREQERIVEQEKHLRLSEAESEAAQKRDMEVEQAQFHGASDEELLVLTNAPLTLAPLPVASTIPKVAGIYTRETWKYEVTNKLLLDKFIAANPRFSYLTEPNATAFGALARTSKSATNIPGVRVWPETNIGSRKV